MKTRSAVARRGLITLALAATALLGGCMIVPVGPGHGPGYGPGSGPYRSDEGPPVGVPPPPPPHEGVTVAPAVGYVWIGGYWAWQLGRHVWIGGRWALPPPGYGWVPGYWGRHHGGGWSWRGGYWGRR